MSTIYIKLCQGSPLNQAENHWKRCFEHDATVEYSMHIDKLSNVLNIGHEETARHLTLMEGRTDIALDSSVQQPMYPPLPHTQCTRVLEFLPDCKTDDMRLRMEIVDVSVLQPRPSSVEAADEEPSRFDALSYTWGPPLHGAEWEVKYGPTNDVRIEVLVDDRSYTVPIGLNLHEALARLHASGCQRPLWIDAMCINQKDLSEKVDHIHLMSQIYSKAHRVWIWMGEVTPIDTYWMIWLHTTFLDLLDRHVAKHGAFNRSHFGSKVGKDGVVIFPMDEVVVPDAPFKTLYQFYASRRYSSRAWVTQEIALAREPIVLIGKYNLPFDRFTRLCRHLGDLGGQAVIYQDDGGMPHLLGITEIERLGWANRVMGFCGVHKHDVVEFLRGTYGSYDDTSSYLALLEDTLSSGAKRLASDPRDQLYSLMGMAKMVFESAEDVIQPDYNASVEAVFTQVTQLLLERLPRRTILSLVTYKPNHADYVQRLPSWVPDFSTFSLYHARLSLPKDWIYSLSGPEYLKFENNRLGIRALPVGKIDFSFQVLRESAKPGIEFVRDVKTQTSLLASCVELVRRGKENLLEPLFRVVCDLNSGIDSDEEFRILWRRFLAGRCVSIPLRYPESTEAVAASKELALMFETLAGVPSIPSPDDLSREEALYKAIHRYVKDETVQHWADRLLAFAEVHPEFPYDQAVHHRFFGKEEYSREAIEADRAIIIESGQALVDYASRRVSPMIFKTSTFFTTENGTAGRIDNAVQTGDELWIISQARVPFVLRPVGTEYQILGEASVHKGLQGLLLDAVQRGSTLETTEIVIV